MTCQATIAEHKVIIAGRAVSVELHGGYYPWVILGETIFRVHTEIPTDLDGVRGSRRSRQIPLPWRRGRPFPRF